MRVDVEAGYRLYFIRRGRFILVLLNASDKSSQKRDLRRALRVHSRDGA